MMPDRDSEIAKLKTFNLVLMVAVVGSICLSVLSLFKPTSAAKVEVVARLAETVEATRFVVKYPDGTLAAEFGIMSEKPSTGLPALRLYEKGVVRAEMCLMDNSRSRFSLKDIHGVERAIMFVRSSLDGSLDDEAALSVQNGKGEDVINIETDAWGNGGISLLDADARSRIQLEVWPKDSLPRVRPAFTIFDAKGKEIVVIPPVTK